MTGATGATGAPGTMGASGGSGRAAPCGAMLLRRPGRVRGLCVMLALALPAARAGAADAPKDAQKESPPAEAPAKDGEKKDAEKKEGEGAKDAKDAASPPPPPPPAPAPAKVATPWPRRYLFPDPGMGPVDGAALPPPWNPSRWRFTVVATIASWNPASAEAIAWLGRLHAELSARKVLVLGAFSHDTATSASRLVKETHPRFPTGLASGAFLKSMGNPKVPTVWIIDPRGEIVARKELPDAAGREALRGDLRLWTDF